MPNPQPFIHVYQKPKAGQSFLIRYPADSYKHRIQAVGGFDTASCKLNVSRAEGETIFEQYIGNRIQVIMDNPFDPIFEGLITRIVFTTPGVVLTRSLDSMGNRTAVNLEIAATANPNVATTVNNTASQAIYGIKCKTLRAARRYTVAGTGTYSTSLAARALNDIAYPLVSVAVNDGSVDSIISLEMQGYYHTMEWEDTNSTGIKVFRVAATGTGWFDIMLVGHANGTLFFSADARDLTDNAQTYTIDAANGTQVWQLLQMLAECGLNAQSWITGIGPYDWNTQNRRLYYKPSATTVKYLAYVNRPGQLFTTTNVPVEPWYVRPDGVIQIADALVGWDGDGVDPRLAYIASVEYDADSGKVSWQSQDNIQIPGALQVDTFHSASDQRYAQRVQNPLT